jgi:hypothetical protein
MLKTKHGIANALNNFEQLFPLWEVKKSRKRPLFTEEKHDEIGTKLETSVRKSLVRHTQQIHMCVSPPSKATKLLHLHPQWFSDCGS